MWERVWVPLLLPLRFSDSINPASSPLCCCESHKKNLQLKFSISTSLVHTHYPLPSKKKICCQCLCYHRFFEGAVLPGITATSGKCCDRSSLLPGPPGGRLEAHRHRLRLRAAEATASRRPPLTSCRNMKTGNAVIFYSICCSSF